MIIGRQMERFGFQISIIELIYLQALRLDYM